MTSIHGSDMRERTRHLTPVGTDVTLVHPAQSSDFVEVKVAAYTVEVGPIQPVQPAGYLLVETPSAYGHC